MCFLSFKSIFYLGNFPKKTIYLIVLTVLVLLAIILLILFLFLSKTNLDNPFITKPSLLQPYSFGINFTPQKYEKTPMYPAVVYQKGSEFLAYGKVISINIKLPWIELLGAKQTHLKTRLNCEKIIEMDIKNNQKKILSLKEGLVNISLGDNFFAVCTDQTCQAVKDCTLIKSS